jgi:hypothetical protein
LSISNHKFLDSELGRALHRNSILVRGPIRPIVAFFTTVPGLGLSSCIQYNHRVSTYRGLTSMGKP